jgi:hypothetical protein
MDCETLRESSAHACALILKTPLLPTSTPVTATVYSTQSVDVDVEHSGTAACDCRRSNAPHLSQALLLLLLCASTLTANAHTVQLPPPPLKSKCVSPCSCSDSPN